MPFIELRGGYKRTTRQAALQPGRMLLAYPMDRDPNVRPGVRSQQAVRGRKRRRHSPFVR
jgi:hypothetical protein